MRDPVTGAAPALAPRPPDLQRAVAGAGLEVEALSPHVGVRVEGIDLRSPLATEAEKALRALYSHHRLLLLHQPGLTDEDQTRFARIFGTATRRERNKVKPAGEANQYVSNDRPDGIFGRGELEFHMDQLFLREPLTAIVLYALEIPPHGGETHFANSQSAYASMPDALKSRIDGLSCVHARAYDSGTTRDWNVSPAEGDVPSWVHPMAWREPATGRRCLWVNKLTTLGVAGMEPEASAELIREVRAIIHQDAFVYRHRWQVGDLILWDNRVLQHARTPFDPAARRTLRRTAIL